MKHSNFTVKISARHPEVTGSCFIIEITRSKLPKENILIDHGSFQGEYENLNNIMDFNPLEIDCVLLTHSHLDHYGLLPMLNKKGFSKSIFCSKVLEKSVPIGLNDSAKILLSEAKLLKKEPLYTIENVQGILPLLKGVEYIHPFKVSDFTRVTFIPNAHLYGSSMIFLEIECPGHETKHFLFTGDYISKNSLFKVPEIPDYILNTPDLNIIEETTYGSTKKCDVKKNLLRLMVENLRDGQDLLMPVIAQERLEVILKYISFAQKHKLINDNISIYVHSKLGVEYYNSVYSGLMKKFKVHNIKFLLCDDYESVLMDRGQKIVLATSGMCDKGPIRFYLQNLLSNPHVTVIVTNYTADGSLSKHLKESAKGDTVYINRIPVLVQAKILWTGCLSSHAKSDEVLDFTSSFTSINSVLLNHGSFYAKDCQMKQTKKAMPKLFVDIIDRETSFIFKGKAIKKIKSEHLEQPYNEERKKVRKFKPSTVKKTSKRHYCQRQFCH